MQARAMILGSLLLLSACASAPTKQELLASPKCVVSSGEGFLGEAVYPTQETARLTTSKCFWGFWGCHYIESRLAEENAISVTFDRYLSSDTVPYGTVKGDEIHRHKFDSGLKGALSSLAGKLAEEKGPILILKDKNQVLYPEVTEKIFGQKSAGKSYDFSPSCTSTQAALGAAVLEYRKSL